MGLKVQWANEWKRSSPWMPTPEDDQLQKGTARTYLLKPTFNSRPQSRHSDSQLPCVTTQMDLHRCALKTKIKTARERLPRMFGSGYGSSNFTPGERDVVFGRNGF